MATYAVRYTQPIMGTDAQGDLVPQPGATVRIRKNGATATVYANRTKTGLANPVPVGVAPNASGLDTLGNLSVWLDPTDGHLYDAEVTVGGTTTIVAFPTIAPDVEDVAGTTFAGAKGDDLSDNNPSTSGALQVAFNKAMNLPGAGAGTGLVRIGKGIHRYTTGVTVTTGSIHVRGESKVGSVLRPVGGIIGIDIQTSGFHTLENLTLDGSLLTGATARLLRLGSGVTYCVFSRVRFVNMPVAVALELLGALDHDFDNCEWFGNNRHMYLGDSDAYPSNQNVFRNPKLVDATANDGAAVEIVNGDGNAFVDGLAQGNNCLKTVLIRNTAGGQAKARGNKIRAMWMESNGNVQAGSRGISIEGSGTDNRIVDAIIRDNMFISSVHDDPSGQIHLEYADSPVIDGNFSNLGPPNFSVGVGPGVVNILDGKNNFAGTVQIPPHTSETALAVDTDGTSTAFTSLLSGTITPQSKTGILHLLVAASTSGGSADFHAIVGGVTHKIGRISTGVEGSVSVSVRLTGLTPSTAVSVAIHYKVTAGGTMFCRPATEYHHCKWTYEDVLS